MRLLFFVLLIIAGCQEQNSSKKDTENPPPTVTEQQGTISQTTAASTPTEGCEKKPVGSGCCKADTPECDACVEKQRQTRNEWILKCVEPSRIVYMSDGSPLEYIEDMVRSCDMECPEYSETTESFRTQCLAKGFEAVPNYCCSIFCTGPIK